MQEGNKTLKAVNLSENECKRISLFIISISLVANNWKLGVCNSFDVFIGK
jgi:hypothetical protein